MCLSNASEVLTVTAGKHILQIRVRTWRVIYNFVNPEPKLRYSKVSSSRRFPNNKVYDFNYELEDEKRD